MLYSSQTAMRRYAALLQDLPKLTFDSKNPHFKNEYLSLSGLLEALTPTLQKHQVVITTGTQVYEDSNVIEVEFIFYGDETEVHSAKSQTILPVLENPQHFGSYVTYVRRYAIIAALNVTPDKDDDAQSIATTVKTTTPGRRGLQRHGR